jgi:hypothetical protein
VAKKAKTVDENYVRMYYEHQYARMSKQEESQATITNFVLTISALAFTFGYQNASQLNVINGVGLPVIIMLANLFAILYINRASEFMKVHQDRARETLKVYAPALKEINDSIKWSRSGFLGSRQRLQKAIHVLLILTALIPIAVYIYQFF